jgi:predicted ATPase
LDKFIQEGLYQLTHAELAFPRANSIYSNDQEYIFKHNLLRDVIYQMIPNSLRRFYHQAVADWMAGISEEDFKIMAADHYEQAGYFNRAAQQFKEAAEIAAQRGAITEQQAFLEQALVLRQMDTE